MKKMIMVAMLALIGAGAFAHNGKHKKHKQDCSHCTQSCTPGCCNKSNCAKV